MHRSLDLEELAVRLYGCPAERVDRCLYVDGREVVIARIDAEGRRSHEFVDAKFRNAVGFENVNLREMQKAERVIQRGIRAAPLCRHSDTICEIEWQAVTAKPTFVRAFWVCRRCRGR